MSDPTRQAPPNEPIDDAQRELERLRLENDLLTCLLDNTSTIAFIKDTDGHYVYGNKAWADTFQQPLENLLGKTDFDLFSDTHAREYRSNDEAVIKSNQAIRLTERLDTPSGKRLWTTMNKFPIPRAEGTSMLGGLGIDITDRQEAYLDLKSSEARLRSFFDLGLIGMAMSSVDKGWIMVNDRLCDILGYSRRELLKKSWTDLTHPEDLARDISEFNRVVSGDVDGYALEKRFIHAEGHTVYARISARCIRKVDGTADRFVALVDDISSQVEAQQALREREAMLNAMSTASLDAQIMIDNRGTVIFWNEAAEAMFGYSRSEAIGAELHELVAQDMDKALAHKGLRQFTSTGKGPVVGNVMEFMAKRQDGSLFPVERSVSSLKYQGKWCAVGTVRDITERKAAEHELLIASDRLTLATRAGGIGVWEWTPRDNGVIWDDQMMSIYNVDRDSFTVDYDTWGGLLDPEDLSDAFGSLQKAMASGDHWEAEFRILWPDKSIRHIRAAAIIERDENGEPDSVIGVNWDITERKEAERLLEELATTDGLTGLFNRRHFMAQLEQETHRLERYKGHMSMVMFDCDHFKKVNDTYGHAVGDDVLRMVGDKSREIFRDTDIVGRVGGEEFAVCLPETNAEAAMKAAERMRRAVEDAVVQSPKGPLQITISLGVATATEKIDLPKAIIQEADEALYAAKQGGRNRVALADSAK